MRDFVRIALLVINITSFIVVAIIGATGIVSEIFGTAVYEKMLEKLKIPWSFEQVWILGFICLAISIIIYLLRKKFFGA